MLNNLDAILLSPSRKRPDRLGTVRAAIVLSLVACFAASPAHADGGNPVPQPAPQVASPPAPTPHPTIRMPVYHERFTPYCSPEADKKMAAALRQEITHDELRIERLKEKIAQRKEEMENIQPGSSALHPIDFAEGRANLKGDYSTRGSRLYRLALDNYRNDEAINAVSLDLGSAHARLRDINCE